MERDFRLQTVPSASPVSARSSCRFRPSSILILAILFAIQFGINTSANAATIVVTQTTDTNDGICDANCSLREAVSASSNGDVIVFSPLFNSPQTITLTAGQINIASKDINIAGSGSSLLTVSGNKAGRIFFISGGAVVAFSGIKLTNGRVATINDIFGGAN